MSTCDVLENLRKAAAGYLADSKFSDFMIICEGRKFNVHRCFISAHSKWFERCCSGTFKEAGAKQAELKEDRVEMVERMIKFFYTCDYDDAVPSTDETLPDEKDPTPVSKLQVNAYVYALAEKYDLKTLALAKFIGASKDENVYTCPSLLRRVCWTLYNHVELPDLDRHLHFVHIETWLLGGSTLFEGDESEKMGTFIEEVPKFGAQLICRWMEGNRAQVMMWCMECGRIRHYPRDKFAKAAFMCGECGGTTPKQWATLLTSNEIHSFC